MMAILSSERERAAQRAEYDANDMKTAEYMSEHIGEEYKGIVTEITDKGMSVRLDNLIEWCVAIRDIEPKDFYKFYRTKHMLASENNSYKLGDEIMLRVKSASKQNKTINFVATGHEKEKKTHENKEKTKTKSISSRQN